MKNYLFPEAGCNYVVRLIWRFTELRRQKRLQIKAKTITVFSGTFTWQFGKQRELLLVPVSLYAYVCARVCTCIHVCLRVPVYMFVFVCLCVWLKIPRFAAAYLSYLSLVRGGGGLSD